MKAFALTLAAVAFLSLSGIADAQSIDKNGKCHDAAGKFAKMEVCKPAAAAPTQCRDVKTKKFAKCSAPNTEPVPSKSK